MFFMDFVMSFGAMPYLRLDESRRDDYVLCSADPAVLDSFREQARTVVWDRALGSDVKAGVQHLLNQPEVLRPLNSERFQIMGEGKSMELIQVRSDETLGRAFRLPDLFGADHVVQPLIRDIEDRIHHAQRLFDNDNDIRIRFHTLTAIRECPFHCDTDYHVMGVSYTPWGTELGPPAIFVPAQNSAGQNTGYFDCRAPERLARMPEGSVSILAGPHREATSANEQLRLWAGIYTPKAAA